MELLMERNHENDPMLKVLHIVIRVAVRFMAVLMALVIVIGVINIGVEVFKGVLYSPDHLLNFDAILSSFGAFMAVLIAIEIFVNITVYLRDDIIHVNIVMATALMAVARKVIVLDYKQISAETIWATAALVLALSIGYHLVVGSSKGLMKTLQSGAAEVLKRKIVNNLKKGQENAAGKYDNEP